MPEELGAAPPASPTATAIPPETSSGTSDTGAALGDTGTLTDEQILGLDEGVPPETAEQPQVQPPETELTAGAAPPPWLKALYADPKVGREAQALWDRTAAFQALNLTPNQVKQMNEAITELGGLDSLKELQDKAQSVDATDAAFFSGDKTQQATVVAEMFEEDRDAIASGVLVSLDVIRQRDPERYAQMSNEVLGNILKADRFDEHLEAMREVLDNPQALKDYATRLLNWADDRGLSQKQRTQALDPRQQELDRRAQQQQQREQTFQATQYKAFQETVDGQVRSNLTKDITTSLTQLLPKTREGIRERIGRDILADIDSTLRGDTALSQKVLSLLHPSRTQYNFDRGTQERVANLLYNRAKQLVQPATKKVVSEWTKDLVTRSQETQARTAQAATRVDITGGAPPGAGARSPLTKEKAKSMSDEEILNWKG